MPIHNKKMIGIISILAGIVVILVWGNIFVKMLSLPFSGTVAEAKVIGYKAKGSQWISQNATSGSKNAFTGRSPFFEFISDKNEMIKASSNAPQIFILFNYEIGEKITVAYPTNQSQEVIILSWKEYPGLLLMMALGTLFTIVGKSYLFKKA